MLAQNNLPTQSSTVYQPVQQKYLFETPGVVDRNSHWIDFWTVIIGIIIVVLIVWFILILFWPNPITNVDVVIIEKTDPVNNTVGSSDDGVVFVSNGDNLTDQTSCLLKSTRKWGANCSCFTPFYGPRCELESYSNKYNALGNPDLNDIIVDLSDQTPTDRLSFSLETTGSSQTSTLFGQQLFTNSISNDSERETVPSSQNIIQEPSTHELCTDMCDNDMECRGVIWTPAPGNNFGIEASLENKPKCQMIESSVIVKPENNIPYSSTIQSTLYLKNTFDPHFKDRVFVYKGDKGIRYWLETTYSDQFGINQGRTMFNQQLIRFNWTPTNLINNTGCRSTNGNITDNSSSCQFGSPWYGIFSDNSFDITNTNLIVELINRSGSGGPIKLNGSQQEFIVIGPLTSVINIPASWRQLWGAFTPSGSLSRPSRSLYLRQNRSDNGPFNNPSETNLASPQTNSPNSQTYQTSQNDQFNLSNSGETITTLYRNRVERNDTIINGSNITHTIRWNKLEFPANGIGRTIEINTDDTIRFTSNDNSYHDLASTNANWSTTSTPFNYGVANPFSAIIEFNTPGTYYIKDRINPLRIRMTIIVK